MFNEVLNQLLIIFSLLIIGYTIRKTNIITDAATQGLSSILLKIALPSTIFLSTQRPYSQALLVEILQIMFIFFCALLTSIVIALLMCKILRVPNAQHGVYVLALGFCNVSFMGYPVIQLIFGEDSLYYASYCNIVHSVLLFSLGIALCIKYSGNKKLPIRQSIKLIFTNNAFLAGIIGFVLFISSITLPHQITGIFQLLSGLTTPISMLVLGAMLTQNRFLELFNDWKQYILASFRLLIIPIFIIYFFRWTGWQNESNLVPILGIILAMPCAAVIPVLSAQYGNEENSVFASRITFITTFFSIVTIPIVTLVVTI